MTARKRIVRWRGGKVVKSYYEAARSDKLRKQRRETGSGDVAVSRAGLSLREQARHLEQNHDLARGALAILVQNTVGHTGIQVEPQPRGPDGKIIKEFARQVRTQWKAWCKRPEVTNQLSFASAQRLLARSYFRDGEVLSQHVSGNIPTLRHGSTVPYSIELIEADFLPMDYNVTGSPKVVQGVEKNAWGRPTGYHVYKQHPADLMYSPMARDLKRIPADRIEHVKLVDRIGQTRGVSVFASVLMRLDDVKYYESSERVAAKVAASMAGYIKKGAPDDYTEEVDEDGDPIPRDMRFRPGMIFDNLQPGEEIGTIDTSRPNTGLESFRNSQLKAVAAGVGVTFSSLARTYTGTFSAQRQELVEGWGAFQILAGDFADQFVRPTYERWMAMAIASGVLQVPAGVDIEALNDALFIAPEMPWIDPLKEADGWARLIEINAASTPEIIRKRGKNPEDVLEQQASWNEAMEERGLTASDEPDEDDSVRTVTTV